MDTQLLRAIRSMLHALLKKLSNNDLSYTTIGQMVYLLFQEPGASFMHSISVAFDL